MEYEDQDRDSGSEPPALEDTPIVLPAPAEGSNTALKMVGGRGARRGRRGDGVSRVPQSLEAGAATRTRRSRSGRHRRATARLGADVPAIDLPPLDESDDVVRGLVKELSSNPSVAAWLTTDNLIRNFVVVVSNIAAGEPAARRVTVLRPKGTLPGRRTRRRSLHQLAQLRPLSAAGDRSHVNQSRGRRQALHDAQTPHR